MFLIASGILCAIFVLNVVLGAVGAGGFMGDVGEMIVLFLASIAFVAAILKREASEKEKSEHQQS